MSLWKCPICAAPIPKGWPACNAHSLSVHPEEMLKMLDIRPPRHAVGKLHYHICDAAVRLAATQPVIEALQEGKEVIVDLHLPSGDVVLKTNPTREGRYLARAEQEVEADKVVPMPWPDWCFAHCEGGAVGTDFAYRDDVLNVIQQWAAELKL